jgi:hypothetical protein
MLFLLDASNHHVKVGAQTEEHDMTYRPINIPSTHQMVNGEYEARVTECHPPGFESPVVWSKTGFTSRSAAMKAAKAVARALV